jgi:S1-C subfamily serine protease
MSEQEESGTGPWTCPSCGRRVPRQIDRCRCGYERPGPVTAFADPGRPDAPGGGRVPAWVIVAPVLLALGAAGGLYLARSPSAPIAQSSAAPAPEAASVASDDDGREGEAALSAEPLAWPADLILPEETSAPSPSAASPVVPPMVLPATLEEVVTRASAAVVLLETPQGRGTGFFVAPHRVLTNAHVVGASTAVTLRFADGRTAPALVERTSRDVDLAIVRPLAPDPAQSILPLGSVRDARAGQEVIAIGSALGVLQNTVTRGIVSAVRNINGVVLIQTDAAINPGNSGGPLLDRAGRVVGITTLKMNADALGFAVAIDHARPLLEGRAAERVPAAGSSTTGPLAGAFGSGPSQADAVREAGEAQFDQGTRALARRADQLDDYWQRFRARCNPASIGGGGDREWFGSWEQAPPVAVPDPQCLAWRDEAVEHAREFSRVMRDLDEAARTAGVYPGSRRDIRRKYRLDWPGWER